MQRLEMEHGSLWENASKTTLRTWRFCSSQTMIPEDDSSPLMIETFDCCPAVVVQDGQDAAKGLDASMYRYTWACSAVLAQFVYFHRTRWQNKRILELSAGTGLPALVAAKCGAADVVVSEANQESLQACMANAQHNKIPLQPIVLPWATVTASLLQLSPVDIILASDLLYDAAHFEHIFFTISFILSRHSNSAVCYMTYQMRDEDWTPLILSLCRKWNIHLLVLPLPTFEGNSNSVAGTDLPGSLAAEIRLFELRSLSA